LEAVLERKGRNATPDNQKTMKTSLFLKSTFTICAVAIASISFVHGQTTTSTYIGANDGNWNNAANWSPMIVPNNSGTATFDVTIDNKTVHLDIDAIITSLSTPGDAPFLLSTDHSLKIGATDEVAFGDIEFTADQKDVKCDLGNFKAFSNHRLDESAFFIDAIAAAGRTARIQFRGADVVSNNGGAGFQGPGNARITDENGLDAFRNFNHNEVLGFFQVGPGRGSHYTVAKSLTNEGEFLVLDGTLTFNRDYTGVGFPTDPGTNGLMEVLAPGPTADAQVIIRGNLKNYDSRSKTLNKSYFVWEAAGGRSSTTQVLDGEDGSHDESNQHNDDRQPFEIVTSNAALSLFGPNTGFRDNRGRDALRNLAVSARLLIGDRDFVTSGFFTSASRLSIFGDTRFIVNGPLTINGGFFEVSPLTGYARQGAPGFPNDPPYISSSVAVRGNFNLPAPAILRFHIFDHTATATITVQGAAVFAGSLQVGLENGANISASDSFTVLTADKIRGQFSNVVNGGRISVFSSFDNLGNPAGNPVGTFLVTYGKTQKTHQEEHGEKGDEGLVLSDFQHN
jgi:hypothetical protein